MRNNILIGTLISATMLPALVMADSLALPTAGTSTDATLPKKGQTQTAVAKTFGDPQKKYAAVGGDAPQHPPITRWDYAGFSVFFERSHVVDAVVPGRPAELYHTETLAPASP